MLIRNATKEDVPAAGAVAAAAYIDDEQDAFMFPGRMKHPQRYLKTKESIIRHGMEDPTATVIVAALEEGEEGWSGRADIVGFCIWFREEGNEKSEKTQDIEKKQPLLSRIKASISSYEVFQYASDLFNPLVSASNASTMARTCRLPSSNHYFCPEIENSPQYGIMDIAVHPEFQGRGVARKLVEWGMKKAREEAVTIELSATPAGAELYTKLGFKKVGVWRWRPGMEGSDGMDGWDIMRWQAEQ
ncbi:acyl-CoA N-acyltransferase [Byssothecium circinans]|uniref:Acyl-CoA N-acyltransferase n=1 Tax=Byssothecium circinans TaxID=147558 RepID=A0A6A5U668_9PLEO|nr:acyl-CoA N-acyltransferase [Byssothecium circinans]